MNQEARIDALEHLLVALVLEAQRNGTDLHHLLANVRGSIMGSKGPGGPKEKAAAAEALKNFEHILG